MSTFENVGALPLCRVLCVCCLPDPDSLITRASGENRLSGVPGCTPDTVSVTCEVIRSKGEEDISIGGCVLSGMHDECSKRRILGKKRMTSPSTWVCWTDLGVLRVAAVEASALSDRSWLPFAYRAYVRSSSSGVVRRERERGGERALPSERRG